MNSPTAQDFSHQDLRNRSFRGQDLSGANFSHADLRGCNFRNANLTGANYTGVRTGKSIRQWAIVVAFAFAFVSAVGGLGEATLPIAYAYAVILPFAGAFAFTFGFPFIFAGDFTFSFQFIFPFIFAFLYAFAVAVVYALPGVFFFSYASKLVGAGVVAVLGVFLGVVLGAVLGVVLGAVLGGVGFALAVAFSAQTFTTGYTYSLIILSALILIAMSFYGLGRVLYLSKITMGTTFAEAKLDHANFSKTNLIGVDFIGARYRHVIWQGTIFQGCRLPYCLDASLLEICTNPQSGRGKELCNAKLEYAYLVNADFEDANLSRANLRGANLQKAKLINTNLSFAKALGTDFSGANLTGAILSNWKIDSQTKFDNLTCDYIYLDAERQERRPASGDFAAGDFAQMMREFLSL